VKARAARAMVYIAGTRPLHWRLVFEDGTSVVTSLGMESRR
jgi:hypothetical protein